MIVEIDRLNFEHYQIKFWTERNLVKGGANPGIEPAQCVKSKVWKSDVKVQNIFYITLIMAVFFLRDSYWGVRWAKGPHFNDHGGTLLIKGVHQLNVNIFEVVRFDAFTKMSELWSKKLFYRRVTLKIKAMQYIIRRKSTWWWALICRILEVYHGFGHANLQQE